MVHHVRDSSMLTPNPNSYLARLLVRTRPGRELIRTGEQRERWTHLKELTDQYRSEVAKAKYFRSRSRHNDALTRFRRALLVDPTQTSTWVDYGYTAINVGRAPLAYEAFLNALELDPSNTNAIEMVFDLAPRIGASRIEPKRYLIKAARDLQGKDSRHLDLLDFLIPFGVTADNSVFSRSRDQKARALYALHSDEGAENAALDDLPADQRIEIQAAFFLLRGRYTAADRILSKVPAPNLPTKTLRRTARRLTASDQHQKAMMVTRYLLKADSADQWAQSKMRSSEERYRQSSASSEKRELLTNGFPLPAPKTLDSPTRNRSVLYLLHNSLPYNSAGYATRSHGLISNIAKLGFDISGVTRPGYPFDRPEAKHDGSSIQDIDFVDDIPYVRLSVEKERLPKSPLVPYVYEYAKRLRPAINSNGASIIHAASNHWNGLAAVVAARDAGIPSVYEVRGLWEITRISRDPDWRRSLDYDFMAAMETEAATAATRVLTITNALKDELVQRGVDESKILVVPNGVDTARFTPIVPDVDLKAELGLTGKVVIGYVGSILDYEGIDTLIEAARILSLTLDNFHVLIVGDGDYSDQAKQRARDLGLDGTVTFTGRIPHSEVARYYSIIDIAPIPRHSLPVTEMVSPLKPFEAMAMGKVVVGSDVDAISEIIIPGTNGLLFQKDSPSDLAAVLATLAVDPEKIGNLGAAARSWVVRERDWSTIARHVADIYEDLLSN